MSTIFILFAFSFLLSRRLHAQNMVSRQKSAGAFSILYNDKTTAIYIDQNDRKVAHRAAMFLQSDKQRGTCSIPGGTKKTRPRIM